MDDPVDDVARIHAHGELAGPQEPVLEGSLAEAARSGARDVLVDLSDVTYVSARVLRQLVVARRRLARTGRGLVVVAPEGPVRRAIELAGPGALDVYDSEREALDAVARRASGNA
jgi:anti-sigma B factor antagonist/stage II sporulation protein AA (anti-sigma F factor antagonist)